MHRPGAAAAGRAAAVGVYARGRPAGERADPHHAGVAFSDCFKRLAPEEP